MIFTFDSKVIAVILNKLDQKLEEAFADDLQVCVNLAFDARKIVGIWNLDQMQLLCKTWVTYVYK